jgi:hypothetical protein
MLTSEDFDDEWPSADDMDIAVAEEVLKALAAQYTINNTRAKDRPTLHNGH